MFALKGDPEVKKALFDSSHPGHAKALEVWSAAHIAAYGSAEENPVWDGMSTSVKTVQ
jgi:hypothetical protein